MRRQLVKREKPTIIGLVTELFVPTHMLIIHVKVLKAPIEKSDGYFYHGDFGYFY